MRHQKSVAPGVAKAVAHGLTDIQVNSAGPHMGHGAFKRRVADQGFTIGDVIKVLTDRGYLGDDGAVVGSVRAFVRMHLC